MCAKHPTHWTRFKNNSSHRTKAHKSADSHLLSLSFAPMIGERMCALFSLNFIQMLFYYASAVLSNVSALPQHHKLFERSQSQKGVTRDMRVHPFAQISWSRLYFITVTEVEKTVLRAHNTLDAAIQRVTMTQVNYCSYVRSVVRLFV